MAITMKPWLLALILLGATAAVAQNITGGLNNAQQIIGGAGSGSGGALNSPGKVVSGVGPPPSVCLGVIDLSVGCVIAVLP
jgi:hypothetical protein